MTEYNMETNYIAIYREKEHLLRLRLKEETPTVCILMLTVAFHNRIIGVSGMKRLAGTEYSHPIPPLTFPHEISENCLAAMGERRVKWEFFAQRTLSSTKRELFESLRHCYFVLESYLKDELNMALPEHFQHKVTDISSLESYLAASFSMAFYAGMGAFDGWFGIGDEFQNIHVEYPPPYFQIAYHEIDWLHRHLDWLMKMHRVAGDRISFILEDPEAGSFFECPEDCKISFEAELREYLK